MPKGDLEAWGQRWNKKLKVEVAFDPSAQVLQPGFVPVEIPAVDEILGGGFARGRTSMIFGEASAGKTLLAQLLIAAAQRQGGRALFFDVERTFHPGWFAMTGVDVTDPEKLLVVRPRNLEQAFDLITDALEELRPEVLVLDSIPALIPSAVLKAKMEDKDFRGVTARKVTEGIGKCTQANTSTALVMINQLRVSMGVTFGNPESLPGGKALRFYASLLLRMRRGKWLTDKGDPLDFTDVEDDKDAKRIGFMLRMRTEKNKLAPPQQETELRFTFDGVVDVLSSNVHLALVHGVISSPSAGYFDVPGVVGKVHGRAALDELLRGDSEAYERVLDRLKEKLGR